MKRKIVLMLWALAPAITGAVVPERADTDSIRYHLDPVVITASKIAESQREIAASVTVISAETLSRSAGHSVLDAVQYQVPGLYLTERSMLGFGVASGAAGGISIRGVGGSPVTGVLVLRDGRPDMMGLMGHPLPDSYEALSIERVEVLRGPASFLYGTNAMGGVINLVSRQRREAGFETRLRSGYGSHATGEVALQHGGKQGRIDYFVTASHDHSDGHRDFSDYQSAHYAVHGGYQAGAGTRLEANAHLANMDLFDPGTVAQPFQDHWYDIRRWGADLSLSHASRHGDTHIRLHGNFGRHRIHDGFRSNDHTHGVMFYHTATPWHHASLTAGFDWKSYGGTASNVITNLDFSDHAIVEYAPYVHLQQLLLKRFILSGGLRRENHEVFGGMMLPKAGVVYNVTPATSVRLSMAKGFRSPTIRELYLFPAPTPDLKPEEVWSREVGLTQLVGERLRFEAALFAAQGKNLIRLKWPRYINSGTFYHTGYEASLNWLPGADFALTATWSKHDLDDQTLYAPGKKATLVLTVPWRTWRCSLQAQHIHDLFAADFHQQPLPDYTLVNASMTWQILPALQARGVVNNLFDAAYQSLLGYPMPGRTGRLEMTLIW